MFDPYLLIIEKFMNTIFFALVISSAFCQQMDDFIGEGDPPKSIRLTDIQIIGSHNSYKVAIEQPLLDNLFQIDSATGRGLQYEHPSFTEQVELGLRSLELDVFHDPEGGYYSNPVGLDIVKASGNTPLPFDEKEKLKVPGLKVFHVQEIDFRSNQLLFRGCSDRIEKLVRC